MADSPFVHARVARDALAALVAPLSVCAGASAALLGLRGADAARAQGLVSDLACALDALSALRRGAGAAPLDAFTVRGDPAPVLEGAPPVRGLGDYCLELPSRDAADALRVLALALAARVGDGDPARGAENAAAAALFGGEADSDEAGKARRAGALKLCEGHELYVLVLAQSPASPLKGVAAAMQHAEPEKHAKEEDGAKGHTPLKKGVFEEKFVRALAGMAEVTPEELRKRGLAEVICMKNKSEGDNANERLRAVQNSCRPPPVNHAAADAALALCDARVFARVGSWNML
jgi:hypothetical protein